jgi:hypothetical protein
LLGTIIHTYLAYHYAARMEDPPQWFRDVPLESALLHDAENRPGLIDDGRRIYNEYKEHYAYSEDEWIPRAVEHEFFTTVNELDPHYVEDPRDPKMPGEDAMKVGAKLDLVVEMRHNGALWIADHKSKGEKWMVPESLPDWDESDFDLHWQSLLYTNIARKHFPIRGFIVQRIKRTLPFDHDRTALNLSKAAYTEIPRTVRFLVREELRTLEKIEQGRPLVPNFAACGGKFGCEFKPLCKAGKHERKMLFETMYKRVEK